MQEEPQPAEETVGPPNKPEPYYPYVPRPADPMPPGMTHQRWLARHTPLEPFPAGSLALGALVFAFFVACFSIVPLTRVFDESDAGAVLVFWCAGMICTGGGVLSTWVAWGDGAIHWRLLLAWSLGLGLFLAWAFGYSLTNYPLRMADCVVGLFSLPLISLAIQLPLWAARVGWGWRLVRVAQSTSVNDTDQPLSIRDLMLATIVVAVSLAAGRVAHVKNMPEEYWLIWGVVFLSVAGISLISIPPVAALAFRLPGGVGCAITLAYATVASFVTVAAIMLASGGRARGWEMVCLGVIICSVGATLAWAGLAARGMGYTLVTSRRPRD